MLFLVIFPKMIDGKTKQRVRSALLQFILSVLLKLKLLDQLFTSSTSAAQRRLVRASQGERV